MLFSRYECSSLGGVGSVWVYLSAFVFNLLSFRQSHVSSTSLELTSQSRVTLNSCSPTSTSQVLGSQACTSTQLHGSVGLFWVWGKTFFFNFYVSLFSLSLSLNYIGYKVHLEMEP